MTNPYENTPTAKQIADRIRDLSRRKTQAEIASEAGFAKANRMSFLSKSLIYRDYIYWSEREDSNLRPPAPEAGALPDCATLRPWRFG